MKILGIDPSYKNFAIVIYDVEHDRVIYNHNYSFHSLSALNKEEKLLLKAPEYKLMNDEQKKFWKDIWDNVRLDFFLHKIKELQEKYSYDVVVTESQFVQAMSDIFACVRIASVIDRTPLPFYQFKPKSWNKILFGNGGMTSEVAKKVTKEKLMSFGIDYGNCQDLYDAHALILTYLKNNNLSKIDFNQFILPKKEKK